ncbi:O-antigen translocase [Microvirga thermotolerans]|uniref:Oligosaccharide flippase family protein n=1 Tax=Microvirga thermotolerans TaxID=2651334 RepID=A0A5P9K014_9HYPH|nr:O-antigen translocase [Microvirga thermotolerans]QFU17869.1 oligosaccharide flippase family protein [Microvirga thermotolerans]
MTDATSRDAKPSYGQILRSTAQIGGSSIVNILLGLVRNKAIALLLGPSGVGLTGLYMAIVELSHGLAGLGISSSGVRQIAEAAGSDDRNRIAVTTTILRRMSLILGAAGAAILFLLSEPVAAFTFGDPGHATGVALLSLAVLLRSVSAGQTALVQGLRRIGDLARINMLSALSGVAVGIPLIYLFREQGIVPSLVVTTGTAFATSWWFSRKAAIPSVRVSPARMRPEIASLLKLGLAFMASSILTMGAAYGIRIIVLHESGIEAAGFYQAAWTLGGLYTGFILQSMSADFYPRLTAAAGDNLECNRLVNEQAHISMLLAGPGVIGTLTFAPLIMTIFYSTDFNAASTLLRWLGLGMMLRVVAWPMGFIVLAKGAQKTFFWTEVAAAVVHVGFAWPLIGRIGVNGAGVAFFALYAWHSAIIYLIVRRMSGFRWSRANLALGLVFLPLAGAVFLSFAFLPYWPALTLGLVATAISCLYSLKSLLTLVPSESLPSRLKPLFGKLT